MAENKKLTVAEILAAARKADGGAAADELAAAAPEAAAPQGTETGAAETEAPAPSKPKLKPGERPSVADMMAMAMSPFTPANRPMTAV